MKKLIIPVAALLVLAGNTKAAGTKTNTVEIVEKSQPTTVANSAKILYSYEMLLEENLKLRSEAAEMTIKVDDLESQLGYTQMMHVTLANLTKEVAVQTAENVKDQMDYARMMHATITNLTLLSAKAN